MAAYQKFPFHKIVFVALIPLVFFLFGFTEKGVKSEHSLYQIDIEIQEQVKVGNNTMKMRIIEQKTMQPINQGAVIEIAAWMAIHEHGTKVAPVIKSMGDGYYTVEMLNFTMPGPWEIYIRINENNIEDSAVINVSVHESRNSSGMKMDH